jgi:hypothetical protein
MPHCDLQAAIRMSPPSGDGCQSVRWLSRYALGVSESPVTFSDEVADHQVIIRGVRSKRLWSRWRSIAR